MTDHEIDQLLATYGGGCGVYASDQLIPAPRSGKSYELWSAEVEGFHGCLDAPID